MSFVDVNECLFVNGGCEDICVNDIGSYHCNCSGGTILAENGYACEGKDETDIILTVLFILL